MLPLCVWSKQMRTVDWKMKLSPWLFTGSILTKQLVLGKGMLVHLEFYWMKIVMKEIQCTGLCILHDLSLKCILTLKALSRLTADDILFFFFSIFQRKQDSPFNENHLLCENKIWPYMWIVCLADNSHEMSNHIFSEKLWKKKKKIINKSVVSCCWNYHFKN